MFSSDLPKRIRSFLIDPVSDHQHDPGADPGRYFCQSNTTKSQIWSQQLYHDHSKRHFQDSWKHRNKRMSHALTPVAEHKQPSQRKQTDACNRQKISCVRNNRRIIQHERSQKLRNTQQHQSQWNIYQDRQDNSFPDTGTYPLLFSGTIILSYKSKKCQAGCSKRLRILVHAA